MINFEEKYIKYKTKYLKSKIMLGGAHKNNFLIIGNIRNDDQYFTTLSTKLKQTLKNKKLSKRVCEYKFKFVNNRFTLDDLTFESVSADIKKYIDKKKLQKFIIISLEESSPFGLFFVQSYPDLCTGIICYPLRLNTKESLDRLYYKYINNNGWKYISKNYDPIKYFFEINEERLKQLFKKSSQEENNIIDLLPNLFLRKQYDKIPKIFNIPTYLFTRLDMDAVSLIKLNFDRKEIAEMKKILSPDDAIYNSMTWNIARIQYDRELIELNKANTNLKIQHIIAFEKNDDINFIIDAVKILVY